MTYSHEQILLRCIELALQGAGYVAPNPMVGCVICENGEVIGEGYHQKYGEAHAEVNAINSVKDRFKLLSATLYVNLEPCSHFGLTPPCSDLIIDMKIPNVVIGTLDINPLVSGKGIEKLKAAGINVITGVAMDACKELNKRFFTFHDKKRPYVILKWAESKDGFIAPLNKMRTNISNEFSRTLVHKWRSEEAAIMVGRKTALADDPKLDSRLWNANNPVRIVIDKNLELPDNLNLFDQQTQTIVFTERQRNNKNNITFIQMKFNSNLIDNILKTLYERNLNSVLVEGGSILAQSFIDANMWDEIRIFTAPLYLKEGVASPKFVSHINNEIKIGDDLLTLIQNKI